MYYGNNTYNPQRNVRDMLTTQVKIEKKIRYKEKLQCPHYYL